MSFSPVESTSKDQFYNLFFEWPSTDPHEVIVTGTFDAWGKTKLLNKTARGFVGNVKVPWDSKVKYKFVVDGKWLLLKGQPTEMDPGGFVNNITFTPPKPAATEVSPEEVHVGTEEVAVVSPPEAEVMPVPEVPVVNVPATKEETVEEEDKEEEEEKPASRLPILPLNSTEHNTVGSVQAAPPPTDYVLPPSPRASKEITQEPVVVSPPEAEDHLVEETPVVTVSAEANKDEALSDAQAPSSRITTLPILPFNSTEHNTVNNAQPAPVVPDYVLPPPPARVAAPAEESAKPLADGAVTAVQEADKDSMGEGLKREQQLNVDGGVPVDPSAESAKSVSAEAKPEGKPKEEEEEEEEEEVKPKMKDGIKSRKEGSTSSSNSSSSSSDSSKTKDGAADAASLPLTPPITPPGKHKRYFSFRRSGSPSPAPAQSPEATPTRPPLASTPSSRSATMTSPKKKKRTSFIGKIKEIFHHDHDDKDSKKHKPEEKEVEKEKV